MSEVNAQELHTFLVLGEELHFGRTAERLFLTPSRVSQLVRQLEGRVGGALFDRTSRSVRLTPLGSRLMDDVRPAYARLSEAIDNARHVARGVTGELRVGMYTPINAGPGFVRIVALLRSRHPELSVTTVDIGWERDQLTWLRRREVDVLATRLPLDDPDVTVGPVLSREERVVIVAESHPLAGRASVRMADLAPYALSDAVVISRTTMNAFIPPAEAPKRVIVRSSAELLLRIALGDVVHPTVRSFGQHFGHPGITSVPLELPPSETALVWLAARTTPAVTALALAAAEIF